MECSPHSAYNSFEGNMRIGFIGTGNMKRGSGLGWRVYHILHFDQARSPTTRSLRRSLAVSAFAGALATSVLAQVDPAPPTPLVLSSRHSRASKTCLVRSGVGCPGAAMRRYSHSSGGGASVTKSTGRSDGGATNHRLSRKTSRHAGNGWETAASSRTRPKALSWAHRSGGAVGWLQQHGPTV